MSKTLFDLQEQQLKHDMKCHRDVFFLSHQDRFKHIALHYGKYSKRLADLVLNPRTTAIECKNIVEKTLVDTMIMILNSGELLQIDFEEVLREKLNIEGTLFIDNFLLFLKPNNDLYEFLNKGNYQEMTINLMLEMVAISGFMQKSAEELDHLMGINREQIKNQTVEFLTLVIIAGSIWNVNFTSELEKRWKEIEEKVIL